MKEDDTSILDNLVAKAIDIGADALEVEYNDGCEEVYARKGNTGIGIAMLPSDGPEATALRRQLRGAIRRKRRVHVEGIEFKLSVREYDSFGETAYHVEIVAG
jgi:hypothetical protein